MDRYAAPGNSRCIPHETIGLSTICSQARGSIRMHRTATSPIRLPKQAMLDLRFMPLRPHVGTGQVRGHYAICLGIQISLVASNAFDRALEGVPGISHRLTKPHQLANPKRQTPSAPIDYLMPLPMLSLLVSLSRPVFPLHGGSVQSRQRRNFRE